VKKIKNKPTFAPVSEGPSQWVIFAVHEVGMVMNFDKTGLVYTITIGFESVTEMIEGVRRTQWKRVTAESLHPKSNLGKIVAAAGIEVPEGAELDPSTLIGKNLTLLIGHEVKDDRTFATIDGYAKLGKGVLPVAPEHKPDEPMPAWMRPEPPTKDPSSW